jgi:hypothetical protein
MTDLDLQRFSRSPKIFKACVFLLGMAITKFNCVHNENVSWHISVDFILLDTSHGLVELLVAMTELNKFVY